MNWPSRRSQPDESFGFLSLWHVPKPAPFACIEDPRILEPVPLWHMFKGFHLRSRARTCLSFDQEMSKSLSNCRLRRVVRAVLPVKNEHALLRASEALNSMRLYREHLASGPNETAVAGRFRLRHLSQDAATRQQVVVFPILAETHT